MQVSTHGKAPVQSERLIGATSSATQCRRERFFPLLVATRGNAAKKNKNMWLQKHFYHLLQ